MKVSFVLFVAVFHQLILFFNFILMTSSIENMEVQIAGNEEERKIMMPLIYIDSHRAKADVEVIILGS
jgi:uncharacterized alpha/beta hydrolase family protein